jgi:hypothetical protein
MAKPTTPTDRTPIRLDARTAARDWIARMLTRAEWIPLSPPSAPSRRGGPAAVCPACQGNSCTHCLSTGLVSRKTHGQIKEQMGKGLIAVEPEDDPHNATG